MMSNAAKASVQTPLDFAIVLSPYSAVSLMYHWLAVFNHGPLATGLDGTTRHQPQRKTAVASPNTTVHQQERTNHRPAHPLPGGQHNATP